jgi:hypothetical protein
MEKFIKTVKEKLSVFWSKLKRIKAEIIWIRASITSWLGIKNRKIVTIDQRSVYAVGDKVLLVTDDGHLSRDKNGHYYEALVVDIVRKGYKVSIGNNNGQHLNVKARNLGLIVTENVTEKEYIVYLVKSMQTRNIR